MLQRLTVRGAHSIHSYPPSTGSVEPSAPDPGGSPVPVEPRLQAPEGEAVGGPAHSIVELKAPGWAGGISQAEQRE